MEFKYEKKVVETAEGYIDALLEGYVNVELNPDKRYEIDGDPTESEIEKLLFERKDESPIIEWKYAKDLLYGRDKEKAYDILMKLAENGFAPAQYLLAICLNSPGFGNTPHDEKKAEKWLKAAAENGYAEAEYNLALAIYPKYFPGMFCGFLSNKTFVADKEKAVVLLTSAAEKNYVDAMRGLAYHFRDVEPAMSVYWWRKATEECGDAVSAYDLANCYADGVGVEQDYITAEKYYELCISLHEYNWDAAYDYSAQVPLCDALFALGELHEKKLLPSASIEKAFEYYRRSASGAEGGWYAVKYKVGQMYEAGIGTEKDYGQAIESYYLAVIFDKNPHPARALLRLCREIDCELVAPELLDLSLYIGQRTNPELLGAAERVYKEMQKKHPELYPELWPKKIKVEELVEDPVESSQFVDDLLF